MFIADSQYVYFCCVICDLPSKQFIDAFNAFENLWHFFDAFGRFDSESIYSSLFRSFWALQFSIILNSSQIRRFCTLQFRIILNSSRIRCFWAQQRPKYNRIIRRFWAKIVIKATNNSGSFRRMAS